MLFNSFTFVIFFVFVLIVLYVLGYKYNSTRRKVFLLLASFVFYTSFHPPFIFLLLASTIINWKLVGWMAETQGKVRRKLFLIIGLCLNLGMLGYFKYADFFANCLNYILEGLSLPQVNTVPNILLPIGISFYTFQAISYIVDVYNKKIEYAHSYLNFSLYLSFFPQLVAGPIVRANTFLPQLERDTVVLSRERVDHGITLVIVGLFIKLIFADIILAPVVDVVFNESANATSAQAWYGVLAFSGQIYFDFNGYSSIAIGLAILMGYDIPINFHVPYAAIGFTDFWRRWHISLSSWIRDYLYIPLGGNRKGVLRTIVNTVITFFLAGLWHGANILFIIWGLLHAFFLLIERALRKWITRPILPAFILVLLTYLLVCVAWVFFRAGSHDGSSLSVAKNILAALFLIADNRSGVNLSRTFYELAMILMFFTLVYQYIVRKLSFREVLCKLPNSVRMVLLAFMLTLVAIAFMDQNRAFIYFQF